MMAGHGDGDDDDDDDDDDGDGDDDDDDGDDDDDDDDDDSEAESEDADEDDDKYRVPPTATSAAVLHGDCCYHCVVIVTCRYYHRWLHSQYKLCRRQELTMRDSACHRRPQALDQSSAAARNARGPGSDRDLMEQNTLTNLRPHGCCKLHKAGASLDPSTEPAACRSLGKLREREGKRAREKEADRQNKHISVNKSLALSHTLPLSRSLCLTVSVCVYTYIHIYIYTYIHIYIYTYIHIYIYTYIHIYIYIYTLYVYTHVFMYHKHVCILPSITVMQVIYVSHIIEITMITNKLLPLLWTTITIMIEHVTCKVDTDV